MKAVIQRVTRASVTVDGTVTGSIGKGLAVLLGVVPGDTEKEADLLVRKITEMRIFTDENDKMNLALADVEGDLLVISQFTLAADCSHGRRPSFTGAARPELAEPLYEYFVAACAQKTGKKVATGIFGADMAFELVNDGPVTIILNTAEL